MPQLPPTVLERLARCGTSVGLTGLVPGAAVEIEIDGVVHAFTAAGAGQHFVVPALDANRRVRARQDDGSGLTSWSPDVFVEDVADPPTARPLLPSQVGSCSHCVIVHGLVPGCDVELMQGGGIVGTGRAGREGGACVGVTLRPSRGERDALTARMLVCGNAGPLSSTPIVPDGPLQAPVVGEPLFGCQGVVPLSQLRPGAKTMIETDTGTYLGWICNCWTAVNVNVLHALVAGESVRATQYWDGASCKDTGPPSGWRRVDPPDERIRPEVQAPLIGGDQLIRVTNQIVGGELVIVIRDGEGMPETRFGPRAASQEIEIALSAPLVVGQQVAAEQQLCGRKEISEWVTVLPPPPVVLAPTVLPPLHECAGSVQVSGLHPGALVRIYQDGIPCGLGWAGLGWSIAVAAAPALVGGAMVTARQWVGGVAGPESAPVKVVVAEDLHRPRIVGPVAVGDSEVVVSGVSPGALVTIRSGSVVLGERYTAESLTRVGVTPVAGPVTPTVRLCALQRTGARVEAITPPDAPGPEIGAGERDVDYGTVSIPTQAVPDRPDDGGFDAPVRGRLYFPADANGKPAPASGRRPLVVIAHGYWGDPVEDLESLTGYAWLARHLARWGMLVLSIDLSEVNRQTSASPGSGTGAAQQWSRATVILAAIDGVLADRELRDQVDGSRVGLVGHSMGGEGVFAAQTLATLTGRSFVIRGVVSLAPTNYRRDLSLENCHYLQLHGSVDYLISGATGPAPDFGGFRLYDRAWRHRTHAWIDGARHQGWNTFWFATPNGEGAFPTGSGVLGPPEQGQIGRTLVNAFFQDVLFSRAGYRGYLEGLVKARGLAPYVVHVQHQGPGAQVVDDMGDPDQALGLAGEAPVDKTINRAGGPVAATGGGPDAWEDVEQFTIATCAQGTRASDVAWHDRDFVYRTELPGGLAASATGELSLRIGVHVELDVMGHPIETWNSMGLDLDLLVELESAGGSATVRVGAAAAVPYPLPGTKTLSVPRTIRLPLDAFTAVDPSFDPGAIRAVVLRPAGGITGRMLIDDVEVAP
jgi:dienelactone hydrolase